MIYNNVILSLVRRHVSHFVPIVIYSSSLPCVYITCTAILCTSICICTQECMHTDYISDSFLLNITFNHFVIRRPYW